MERIIPLNRLEAFIAGYSTFAVWMKKLTSGAKEDSAKGMDCHFSVGLSQLTPLMVSIFKGMLNPFTQLLHRYDNFPDLILYSSTGIFTVRKYWLKTRCRSRCRYPII